MAFYQHQSQPNQIQLPTATGVLNCLSKSHVQFTGRKPHAMQQHFKNHKVCAGASVPHEDGASATCTVAGLACLKKGKPPSPLRTTDVAQAEGGNPVSTILPLPCSLSDGGLLCFYSKSLLAGKDWIGLLKMLSVLARGMSKLRIS